MQVILDFLVDTFIKYNQVKLIWKYMLSYPVYPKYHPFHMDSNQDDIKEAVDTV